MNVVIRFIFRSIPEKFEENIPVITPFRRKILDKINSAIKSTPGSRGLALVVTYASPSPSNIANALRMSKRIFASTLRLLKFAVVEDLIYSQEHLADLMYTATSNPQGYPRSSDYSIVVVVAGVVRDNVETLLILHQNQQQVNISRDLIEPFLPPSAPALADIPKIFLVNTITLGGGHFNTSRLSVPPEGNFLLSYINVPFSRRRMGGNEGLEYLSDHLCHELTVSRHSIEDVLTEFKGRHPSDLELSKVKGQLPPIPSMTVISHLDKPVYLNPAGHLDPTHTGEFSSILFTRLVSIGTLILFVCRRTSGWTAESISGIERCQECTCVSSQ